MRITISLALALLFLCACEDKTVTLENEQAEIELLNYLPFQELSLTDLSAFKEVPANWTLAKNVNIDKTNEFVLTTNEGSGVLVNNYKEEKSGNLLTNFEHGDIEVELDVMLPKNSNSGLYFQGRYEIQLFDSWGKKDSTYANMGGIYQGDEKNGVKGFPGKAPNINAAKSPGLWQHFKILFHAPRFSSNGEKIANAQFKKVWLNGVLIHENVEISAPTRSAVDEEEKPMGPFMIQGDHGSVAFKNIEYKLYKQQKVSLIDMKMKEYENVEVLTSNFDSLPALREIDTDTMSSKMLSKGRTVGILKYTGNLHVPDSGDYLFDLKVAVAGSIFILNKDTLVDFNGNYNLDSLGVAKVNLKKGLVPFQFIYHKQRRWSQGFSLEVEGPGIEKYALSTANSLNTLNNVRDENMMVNVIDEPVTQRSFIMHKGVKRTHCISVATLEGINYSYDLARGSLIKAWSGNFIDASLMWQSRGQKQLATPVGFVINFHGNPEFAQLENPQSEWPNALTTDTNRKQLGYEFDENRIPTFFSQIGASVITDKMIPSATSRVLKRIIHVNGKEIWHKVAAGETIEKLSDGSFIINDESYFIEFSSDSSLSPIVRANMGIDELLVRIPEGEQQIEYNIVW